MCFAGSCRQLQQQRQRQLLQDNMCAMPQARTVMNPVARHSATTTKATLGHLTLSKKASTHIITAPTQYLPEKIVPRAHQHAAASSRSNAHSATQLKRVPERELELVFMPAPENAAKVTTKYELGSKLH